MSRVVRKKNPTQIHMDMRVIRSEKSDFVILDSTTYVKLLSSFNIKSRQKGFCRDFCRVLMNITSSLVSWSDLNGFNTKLEHLFLEVLNSSQIYSITNKVRFVKGLANLHNYVSNNSHICPNSFRSIPQQLCHNVTDIFDE